MQLSWLSPEQAWAVTEEQWAELDSEQRQALGMAQYEGELMFGHRGTVYSTAQVLTSFCCSYLYFNPIYN